MYGSTEAGTDEGKDEKGPPSITITADTHKEPTCRLGRRGGMNTDQLRNGISALENTLLHTGGMELDDQIGKDRGENCIVHVIQEEREQSDRHNQTVTFLESHASERCSRCERELV